MLVFGQEAYFEPIEAAKKQRFGRMPRLKRGRYDTHFDSWHFRAKGNGYELEIFEGKVWRLAATFSFRPLGGHPHVFVGEFHEIAEPPGPDVSAPASEPDSWKYYILQKGERGDFIGYPDFVDPDGHCYAATKRALANLQVARGEYGDCSVHRWQQVEALAWYYARSRPSPLGILHRIDRKKAEAPHD